MVRYIEYWWQWIYRFFNPEIWMPDPRRRDLLWEPKALAIMCSITNEMLYDISILGVPPEKLQKLAKYFKNLREQIYERAALIAYNDTDPDKDGRYRVTLQCHRLAIGQLHLRN
jgi:hypothetical protein